MMFAYSLVTEVPFAFVASCQMRRGRSWNTQLFFRVCTALCAQLTALLGDSPRLGLVRPANTQCEPEARSQFFPRRKNPARRPHPEQNAFRVARRDFKMGDSRHSSAPLCGANPLPLQIILLFRFSLVLWEIWVHLHFLDLPGVPLAMRRDKQNKFKSVHLADGPVHNVIAESRCGL
jgi:hypothetical protein